MIETWTKAGEAKSVGLLGNAADIYPELVRRNVRPDIVTDQTSAHDPINGYLPQGWSLAEWRARRESDPKAVERAARASMRVHVEAMVAFWNRGVPTLDYGNNIRQVALDEGFKDAFAFPGFVPAYIRPLFCRGIGPFRWAALSGDPEDIYKTDQKVKEVIPDDEHLHQWLDMARQRIAFQGLPARICWVGLGQRHRLGLAFNEMVRTGELSAPVVIGRDHLDSGSVASPNRETEAMKDGSDAVSDWPLLNALLNTRLGRDLGVAASRRRRRHGLLAACRHGHLRRRHGSGRAPARTRAVERSGDRRHAPCRCRLRGRHRLRARKRAEPAGAAIGDRQMTDGIARFSLDGKCALVTGASRGIGQAIAVGLAEAGADIVAVARTRAGLAETREKVEALRRECRVIEADLSDTGTIAGIFAQLAAAKVEPDVLVNNAGTEEVRPSVDITEDLWDRILDVNLKSAFFVAQSFARPLLAAGRAGSIINLGSLTSAVGVPTATPYTSSKSGILGMTRALSTEWSPRGIRVNAIGPGYFRTELTEAFYQSADWQAKMLDKIPMGRFGALDDLVGVSVFLASGASAYLTGQIIYVDGGYLGAI